MSEVYPPASEQHIRAFVAIELPNAIKEILAHWQERLKTQLSGPSIKWAGPQGIHLTLKFLGHVPSPLVPQIEATLVQGSRGLKPLQLELTELGVFPNWQRPRVVWVGIGGEREKLAKTQRSLEIALSALGFAPESRPFSPHLTLARLRPGTIITELKQFRESAQALAEETLPTWEVTAISLMRSQLTPKGAIYHRLALFPLGST
ncbi:MAG: RNA 2',3'-cyclic phosphodiesterase [Chloroflexi bacterium]|nr:RNA 2',3'-cyclic phosphodiesterase [Chloroflexota bacterium]